MRATPYGEPSDREIDALRLPPVCPECGNEAAEYGEPCETCTMKHRNKTQPLDANLKDVAPTLVLYLIGVILVILALGTLTTWVDAKFSNPQHQTP